MESQPRKFRSKWVDAAATQKSICPQTSPAQALDTDSVNGSIFSHTSTKLWDHVKLPATIQLWTEWKGASQTPTSAPKHETRQTRCFHFMLVFPCFISTCRWLHNNGDTLSHKTRRQFNLLNEFPLWGASRGHKCTSAAWEAAAPLSGNTVNSLLTGQTYSIKSWKSPECGELEPLGLMRGLWCTSLFS